MPLRGQLQAKVNNVVIEGGRKWVAVGEGKEGDGNEKNPI